jgi:hypothetical protein
LSEHISGVLRHGLGFLCLFPSTFLSFSLSFACTFSCESETDTFKAVVLAPIGVSFALSPGGAVDE